jgi:MinD superfamily P-loop ATPase
MTTISIASGKGGAGKTSIAAALAAKLGPTCVFADCDVDAANGAIAIGAVIKETEPYAAGPGFRIQQAACLGCGACADSCRFEAIESSDAGRRYFIVPELCERCGACADRCPSKAITTYDKIAGELFASVTRLGSTIVHAELVPGEDTSGKLVRKVRERAQAIAGEDATIIVDAPPGIGCPVIASISGCDLVVVVVEASSSGIRDAERLAKLIVSMKRRSVAIINKVGLSPDMDARARDMLKAEGIPLAGEIPFHPSLRSAEESGETWMTVDSVARLSVASALRAIQGVIDTIGDRSRVAAIEGEKS